MVVTFAAKTPESVSVQVVLDVTQSTRSPVVGAVANPKIVFDAVAALPHVVVKLPDAGNIDSVPAVPESPSVGVTVHEDAEELDVFGIAPADGAEVAFVPP